MKKLIILSRWYDGESITSIALSVDASVFEVCLALGVGYKK